MPRQQREIRSAVRDVRRARRCRSVKVQYQNEQFQTRLNPCTGFTAQIIRHEIGRCGGVLIQAWPFGTEIRPLHDPDDLCRGRFMNNHAYQPF